MKKVISIILLGFVSANLILAQEAVAPSETTVTDIDTVLKHAAYESPDMIDQRLQIAQNNADRLRGWATYFPQVTMSYRLGGTHEVRKSIKSADATRVGGSYSINASHPIYHWGGIESRREMGFSRESAAQKQAIISYARLVKKLRESHGKLVVDKYKLVLADKKIEDMHRSFEKMKVMVEQGRKSSNELAQLELSLKNLKLQRTYQWNQLERSLVLFRNESGFLTLTVETIPTSLEVPEFSLESLQSEYREFIARGFDRSVVTDLATEEQEAIEAQIVVTESKGLPTLDIQGGMSQQPVEVNNKYELQTMFYLGFGGSWALFDRDEASDNKRSLLLRKRQVDARLATSRAQLFAEGKHILELINTSQQSYALRQEQLKLAQDEFEVAKVNYQRGDIDQEKLSEIEIEVLTVESELLQDKSNLLSAYYSFLGTLFLDPALHYFDPSDQRL